MKKTAVDDSSHSRTADSQTGAASPPQGRAGTAVEVSAPALAFKVPELLAAQLANFLEEQIVFGDLAPNVRLVEEAIVQKHGVSRSPVREAFRSLEQGGLIVRESRKGVSVSPTSKKNLDEVYSCRMVLEGLAAEEAARNRSDDDVVPLRTCLAHLQDAHKAGDVREYFRRNVDMSTKISDCANSATLTRLLASLGKQALRYRYLVYSKHPEMMVVSLEINAVIVDAIARQNPRHARSLTEDLILRSWRSIAPLFDSVGPPEGS